MGPLRDFPTLPGLVGDGRGRLRPGPPRRPLLDEETLLGDLNPVQREAVLPRGRAARHRGRRRIGQDPGAHEADRPHLSPRGVAPWRIIGDHLHEQGGRRGEPPRRRPVGEDAEPHVGLDVPLGLCPHPPASTPIASVTARFRSTTTPTHGGSSSTSSAISGSTRNASRREPSPPPSARRSRSCSTWRATTAGRRRCYERRIADTYAEYERRLVEANAMDFDDLLVRVVRLFHDHLRRAEGGTRIVSSTCSSTSSRTRTRPRTRSSPCSGEAPAMSVSSATPTRASTGSAAPRCGTCSTSSASFPTPGSIFLEQNYRSTQTILDAANAVIANNLVRQSKHFWSALGEGEKIKRYRASDGDDEPPSSPTGCTRARSDGAVEFGESGRLLPHERPVAGAQGRP